MINKVKDDLTKMKNDRPGKRFRNEHKRAKAHGITGGWIRVVVIILAIVSAAIGVVLVFIPGPAFVFFILSGALVASQWWAAARVLDKNELVLHRLWRWAKRKWSSFRKPHHPARG
ncbi:hypothetical protein RAHE111665_08910 [Rariglobus hedericola]